MDTTNGTVRTVVEQGTVRSIAEAGGRLIYGLDHLRSPVELYSVGANGGRTFRVDALRFSQCSTSRDGRLR